MLLEHVQCFDAITTQTIKSFLFYLRTWIVFISHVFRFTYYTEGAHFGFLGKGEHREFDEKNAIKCVAYRNSSADSFRIIGTGPEVNISKALNAMAIPKSESIWGILE